MPYMITGVRNQKQLMDSTKARACPGCQRYTHLWEDMGDLRAKIDRDWSLTEEGFQIVSRRFRETVSQASTSAIEFISLSNGCSVFRPNQVVFLDVTKALERTKGPCSTCGRLSAFLGVPTWAGILAGQRPIEPNQVVRSAQAFGGDQLVYEISIFGDEVVAALQKVGLRGSVFWEKIET